MRYLFIVFVLLCFGCQQRSDLPTIITLNDGWQFKHLNDSVWRSATVSGNVFSDLLEHQLIPDPFIGDNEHKVQWVSETDWEYRTSFLVDQKTLRKKNITLNFEGLDTYASVYLNDSLILKSNNAFRQWNVKVKSLLKSENELRIVFEPTSIYEEQEKAKLPYTLPEGNRIFTRKAQFQYGWDWGPKLNVMGIWRPIALTAWNDYKIEAIYVEQLQLNDSLATLRAYLETDSETEKNLAYLVYVNDSIINQKSAINNQQSVIDFQIKNPKRWWPHNLGEPYLYDIKVIVKEGNTILDSVSTKIGLRTIELITEKDSIGESFYFKVNDVPVYAKGANYIPQHSSQNEVTEEDYEKLIDDVVDANMNMLRVWGGGIYEDDFFYDLCDEKGILVWQDFMFACAMYPGDEAFLENVQQEAIDNVKRLRNHASIALWCGNNENSEGWHRWGWQDGRKETEKAEIWSNYLKVFDSILPQTVSKLSQTAYWESSPRYGRGNPSYEFEGDAHDWWVWHDGYPFEHFEEHVPRFMSEFGFQSFPSYEVIKFINQSDSINITSDSFKSHQKHHRGFQLIDEYMSRDFPVPNDIEDYVYMSQLVQAYGITKGVEAHRRAKPKNMGTLYWQLNDCWPAVSWSSIDFFGNWKALHYKAKKSFKNILVSSTLDDSTLKTYIINDELKSSSGDLSIKIINFKGEVLLEDSKEVKVLQNSSQVYHELNLKPLPLILNEVVAVVTFGDASEYFYFVKPKDLNLQKTDIQQSITKTEKGFTIELFSTSLQKDVFLFCKEEGHFSDNFFDLVPNEKRTVEFRTSADDLDGFNIISLNNFIR